MWQGWVVNVFKDELPKNEKGGGKLTHFQMEVIFDQKLFIVQRLMYLREKISNKMRR